MPPRNSSGWPWAFVKRYPKVYGDFTRLLNRNRIFVERTKNIGLLTREEAISRSATGPVARASGVPRCPQGRAVHGLQGL